jgi:uncharacterized phage protein (TIGR01671 family)
MREIKFRCWFASKMWYAIPAIRFDKDGVRVVDLNHDEDDFSLSPDTWTGHDDYVLMQFTGMKDKNGRNIYEGDIVTGTAGKYSFIVQYRRFGYMGYSFDGRDEFNIPDTWEVIGNIYENPELLSSL